MRGHRCQRKQLYLLMGEEKEEEELDHGGTEICEPNTKEDMQISVHALAGSNSFRTMRLTGTISNYPD